MNVLSLFDGISCARVALERIGISDVKYYAAEIDKHAISVSRRNYPDIVQLGSVVDLHPQGEFDLLIGGSPCQDLSIAKKNREGLKGARSGLFYEYVRILKEVKPRYFILENVNSMSKESRETITKELFGIEPIMINAALVSAQNRKRLFWVGARVGGTYVPVPIPQPKDKGILLKDILESGSTDRMKSYCIDANYYKGGSAKNYLEKKRRQLVMRQSENRLMVRVGDIGSNAQAHRVYSPNGKSVALSALGGGQGAKTGLYLVKGVASRTYPRYPNGEKRTKQIEVRDDEKANSLTSVQSDSMVSVSEQVNNIQIRKLTPIECERLQGLPDNYTEGVSNTQRYKALRNAFNVDVVAHILGHLFEIPAK